MAQESANFFWEKNYENLMKALTVLNPTPNKNFLARIVPEFDNRVCSDWSPLGSPTKKTYGSHGKGTVHVDGSIYLLFVVPVGNELKIIVLRQKAINYDKKILNDTHLCRL